MFYIDLLCHGHCWQNIAKSFFVRGKGCIFGLVRENCGVDQPTRGNFDDKTRYTTPQQHLVGLESQFNSGPSFELFDSSSQSPYRPDPLVMMDESMHDSPYQEYLFETPFHKHYETYTEHGLQLTPITEETPISIK